MDVFLPIAGMSVNVLLAIGIGALVGFLSGLFGVGGGFVLTPLLMLYGIPPAVAAASGSGQMVAAAGAGAVAHSRMGHMDVKMGIVLVLGGVLGGTIGVPVVRSFRTLGDFDFVLRVIYVLMLGGMGALMFIESLTALRKFRAGRAAEESGTGLGRSLAKWFQRWPLQMSFERSGLRTSALFPILAGTLVGFLTAMGMGGGFIMVPTMIYIIGMPTIIAVGTSLLQIALVLSVVTVEQAITNHIVDIPLVITLFCGSVLGVQIGARVSKLLRSEQIRILLALLVLAVAVKIGLELMARPEDLIGYARATGGH